MKSSLKQALFLLAIITLVFAANKFMQYHLGQKAIENIQFPIYSFSEAKQLAGEQGKLVLADYSAVWCPSCRKLKQQVFSNSSVANLVKENFIFANLDADLPEGENFAQKYNLFGFPRVLVLNPNGEKLIELPLTFDPIEYEFNLNKVNQAFSIPKYNN